MTLSWSIPSRITVATGRDAMSAAVGRVVADVTGEVGGEVFWIRFVDGSELKLDHDQQCCESVTITDIAGDPSDLVGSELVVAEERCSEDGSGTWTYYTLASARGGYVDLRWLGRSNGYYSERVDVKLTVPNPEATE